MAEESRKGTNWWLWGGLAAAAAFFLTRKASAAAAAAGQDPNSPPPAADPTRSRLDLMEAWAAWIPKYLAQYGYVLLPSYNNTTNQIADAVTGDYMALVRKNQAVTDNHLGFWWKYTEIKTGAADINNDATWGAIQGAYSKLVQDLTPQFLAK
jgi:hypothetical protein